MTAETLKKQHVEEMIQANVRARAGNVTSSWMKSKMFMPIRDTNISAPAVKLSPSSNSIVVNITTEPLMYFTMYPEKKKKALFNITVSNMSKFLWTNITAKNVLEINHLPPDHYCISVKMKFEEITSNSSQKICVNLNDLVIMEVILGSAAAICVSIVIVVTLAVYLIVYRHALHPKAHLPSNLIFNDVKSKSSASDYKSDETFLAPSIFEGMEFCKHTAESLNNEEHPENKRYVSTETCKKKYYVNFRQKYTDANVPLTKTVELRNSTYGTNAAEDYSLDYPSIWISPEAKETLHYGQICNEYDYYNKLRPCEEGFRKLSQLYFNQEEKPHCLYINDQFQAYSNISGNQ